jgi:hypothetical protein
LPDANPRRSVLTTTLVLSLAILVLWSFPRFWYTKTDPRQGLFWLAEQPRLAGWSFQDEPVSEAAEAVLAADKIVNGLFGRESGAVVRVFSAKRYSEKASEFDMFSHTPDRCWTSVGWKVEPVSPEFVELKLHGVAVTFERRIFSKGAHRELVYFGALVGGQPLPYRIDQYLDVGVKRGEKPSAGIFGKALGALDARLLIWPWKSFVNRRPLAGPKQLIRVSTPLIGSGAANADALLSEFLPQWLALTDYGQELEAWQRR